MYMGYIEQAKGLGEKLKREKKDTLDRLLVVFIDKYKETKDMKNLLIINEIIQAIKYTEENR